MTEMMNVYFEQDENSHPDYRRNDAPGEQPFPLLLLNVESETIEAKKRQNQQHCGGRPLGNLPDVKRHRTGRDLVKNEGAVDHNDQCSGKQYTQSDREGH